jgi:methionyl aminopeptidase
MIRYKSLEEIEIMRESAMLVSETLGMLAAEIKPGVSPLALDALAEQYIRDHKAVPGFLGLYDCPNTLLTSVNEQVVHGIPTNRSLKEGDIVSIDCGVFKNGFYGDQAFTFMVGKVSDEVFALLKTTYEALYLGLAELKVGNRIGDIGCAIETYATSKGYGVVKELVGHGLGQQLHEEPQVPNFGRRGKGKKIQEGLVVAIEPMINMGTHRVKQLKDGWTIVTHDGKPSAHYEHDVAVVNGQPEILSSFEPVFRVTGNPFGS